MKTSLDHLPEAKRRELARAAEILFAEFKKAMTGGSSTHKHDAQILKVVLFGSYARGDWVDDPVGGYVSDYFSIPTDIRPGYFGGIGDQDLRAALFYWDILELPR